MDKIRVLVVEDSVFSQKMVENALLDSEYQVCDVAGTGGEGLNKYRSRRPDIVTMDLNLPDMDGLECCREILNYDPQAKIIILSGMKDEALIQRGTSLGVRGFLQKPVKQEQLLEILDHVYHVEQLAENNQSQLLQYFMNVLAANLSEMVGVDSKLTLVQHTGLRFTCHGLAIVIGITGTKHGRLILDLTAEVAEVFARRALQTDVVSEEDVLNSMTEFANIIAGNSVSEVNNALKDNQFEIRITPPSVFIGKSLAIMNAKMASSTVEAQTEIGKLYMNVGFVGGIIVDVKMINPFIEAISSIMPQLGFQTIVTGKISVGDQFMLSKGVTVLVGLTDDMRGNIAYNMTEDTAKKIASTMMMGMPVAEMDEMAQSAISEMTNMITGNAATHFGKSGMKVDISPPSVVIGADFTAKVGCSKFIIVEMLIDSLLIELNIGLL